MSVLGIDFGTSNSSASYIKSDGIPEVIRFVGHDLKMPSVVSFYGDKPLFGYEVQYLFDNMYGMSPEEQRKLLSTSVKSIKKILDKDARINGYTHAEIVAMFLKHLREQAQKACPTQTFDKIVLTHPVKFEEWKKKLYIEAASQSGFDDVELLYEPVAAAIGYLGKEQIQNARGILVYDFGGGTFDVAYVTKQDGRYIVPLPPEGDSNCGGDDIDDALYKYVAIKASEKIGNEYQRRRDLSLLFRCKGWKEMLSSLESIPITVMSKVNPSLNFSYTLKKEDVESVASIYINKTLSLTKDLFSKVQDNRLPLDFILLIGGSSNMPIIKSKLEESFPGIEIRTTGSADIAVALGASYHALEPVNVDPENEWCYCMYDGKKILKSYNFCIYCGKPNFFKTGKF